jgi:multicomponent Na+:H+ antiporter subunit F
MTEFLLSAGLFVLATVAVGLLRLLHGPDPADRLMSAQLLGTGGIGVLLLVGVAITLPGAIDVALTLALLAAFVSAAFVTAAKNVAAAEPKDGTEA